MILINLMLNYNSLNIASIQVSPSNLYKFAFAVVYFLCMIFEIFVPCYYGSVVIAKSNQLTRDMYFSNWLEQKPKYKSAMLILTLRTFRPVTIYGGGIFSLNLVTFLSVSKFRYKVMNTDVIYI